MRYNAIVAVFIGIVVAIVLSGIADGGITLSRDWNTKPTPYTINYMGKPLHCFVTEDGAQAGNIGGLTCDYVRYWGYLGQDRP